MSRTVASATKAVEKALGDLQKWQTKVRDAADQKLALEAGLGDALLDDPEAEERTGSELERLGIRVRSGLVAVETAEARLEAARRDVLEAEAAVEEGAAAAALKDHAKHESKVDALLRQLEELDGVSYEAVTIDSAYELRGNAGSVGPGEWAVRRLDAVHAASVEHSIRAAVLHFVAERGVLPVFTHDLPTRGPGWGHGFPLSAEQIPEAARAFVAQSPNRVAVG